MEKQNAASNSEHKNTSTISDFTKKSGDSIEKLGNKVSQAGFKKTGEAIEKAGDRFEHMLDGVKVPKKLSSMVDGAATMIRRRPIATVGGALLIGYVAKRMLFSRSPSSRTET